VIRVDFVDLVFAEPEPAAIGVTGNTADGRLRRSIGQIRSASPAAGSAARGTPGSPGARLRSLPTLRAPTGGWIGQPLLPPCFEITDQLGKLQRSNIRVAAINIVYLDIHIDVVSDIQQA